MVSAPTGRAAELPSQSSASEPWSPDSASALVRHAQAEVDRLYGERGYELVEQLRFNGRVNEAWAAKDLAGVRAACQDWRADVDERMARGGEPEPKKSRRQR